MKKKFISKLFAAHVAQR